MKTKFTIKLNEVDRIKEFVNEVSTFVSDIDLIRNRYVIDAKSLMGIFSIDLSDPLEIKINSSDENEIIRFNEFIKKYEV